MNLGDIVARAKAVTQMRGSEDFLAVSAAFKRMKNILSQAKEKGFLDAKVEPPTTTVVVEPSQEELSAAAVKVTETYWSLAAKREYIAALELMATLRPQIDAFFDQVMVMDENPYVRQSRLNLLSDLVGNFSRIADFSEIVVAG